MPACNAYEQYAFVFNMDNWYGYTKISMLVQFKKAGII